MKNCWKITLKNGKRVTMKLEEICSKEDALIYAEERFFGQVVSVE